VTRRGSPRIEGYAIVLAAGLVGALLLRRPELAALAAPFALLLVLGTRASDPSLDVRFETAADRALEATGIDAQLSLATHGGIDRLDVQLDLPPGIELDEGSPVRSLRLAAGEERDVPVPLRCTRWGLYDLGAIDVQARDVLRLVVWEAHVEPRSLLRVYPRQETLDRIIAPVETQAFTGSEVARVKGAGIEYADIRDFAPGDRVRSINWRASARRNALVVNERHPERNTDVVLFLDSFADVRYGDRSTLEDAVRVTASLATRYLERRDRVGLVTFGGILRWLQPGMGVTQRYRLLETLLETGVEPTYAWRDVAFIPARILPPKALVVALTALVDPRFVRVVEDLRARGFDIAVVELDPSGFVEAGKGEVARVAHRMWLLEREVLRARIERLGVGVARVDEHTPLEVAVEGVRTYRRHARLARA
jgi:uncharacterized protein (DUF58 family)